MKLLGTLALMTWLVLLSGCLPEGNELRRANRRQRLMAMAVEEAQTIDDVADRLRRQLNAANMQIVNGRFRDGRKTLGHARVTVEGGKSELDFHGRLAGWVSISELSRMGGYDRYADAAIEKAIETLRSIEPKALRCEYVRGVAQEVLTLRGKKATAELLRESAEWVAEISDRQGRRKAYVAIASDLFNCDDYIGGRNVLRCDGDSKWRTEILITLAKEIVPLKAFGKSVSFLDCYYTKEHRRGSATEVNGGRGESGPASKPAVPKAHKTQQNK